MKQFNYRFGNIEVRPCTGIDNQYEVVKWFPNKLYGKADEFKKDDPLDGIVYEKDGVRYSESCFAHPETCYVLSFIEWNSHEPCWEVREVSTRPFDLEHEDFQDWCYVMRKVFSMLPEPRYDNDY